MPFGSSSQTVITWQFGAVSQEENSVSLCYDSALVFGGTSGDGQCDWVAEAGHTQQVLPNTWHDGVSCGDRGCGPRGPRSGVGGARGCTGPGGAPSPPQAGRGPNQAGGSPPCRAGCGALSVVGGRTPRWHLVASLVGGLPEAHWKHHFLMQTNDGAAQRSPTAGRRS